MQQKNATKKNETFFSSFYFVVFLKFPFCCPATVHYKNIVLQVLYEEYEE